MAFPALKKGCGLLRELTEEGRGKAEEKTERLIRECGRLREQERQRDKKLEKSADGCGSKQQSIKMEAHLQNVIRNCLKCGLFIATLTLL